MNQQTERSVLTQQEAVDLINRLKGPARLMARLMYVTGLRLAEIVDLRVKDVDLAARRLYIRRSNGARDRIVALPEELVQDLAAQLARTEVQHRRDLKAGLGTLLPPEVEQSLPLAATRWCWQFLFAGEKPVVHPVTGLPARAPASTRGFLQALNAAARRTGIERSLHSHELRHACAARLAEAGRPLVEIQELMGHEDLRVTAEYARRLEANRAPAADLAVDRAWIVHYSPEAPKGLMGRLRAVLAA